MSGSLLALGLGNSLLWSLYLLLTRHVVNGAALDAWAYTLMQLLFAGLIMLWLGRRAAGRWYELLAPWTVGYAFLRVARSSDRLARHHREHAAGNGERADRGPVPFVGDPRRTAA